MRTVMHTEGREQLGTVTINDGRYRGKPFTGENLKVFVPLRKVERKDGPSQSASGAYKEGYDHLIGVEGIHWSTGKPAVLTISLKGKEGFDLKMFEKEAPKSKEDVQVEAKEEPKKEAPKTETKGRGRPAKGKNKE